MSEDSHIVKDRRAKTEEWLQKSPYPNQFRPTLKASEARIKNEESSQELFSLAGRLRAKRVMGKTSFSQLVDASGSIQLFLKKDVLGIDAYALFNSLDLGDFVGVTGSVFTTKTGEVSIRVTTLVLLSKCFLPLPEKYHGLTNPEQRVRKRYLDLIMSDERRALFMQRSEIISHLRSFCASHSFMEVETPMMHPIPGGATAKPFVTFHNQLKENLYLRIAPELYLKKLLVGGFEKIFEINRSFRNEGVSTRHNPEFTMIELYQAYADYTDMMQFTESLIRFVAHHTSCALPDTPFAKKRLEEVIVDRFPELKSQTRDAVAVRSFMKHENIIFNESDDLGMLLLEIFEKRIEHQLLEPVFITHYPLSVSPLARASDDDDFLTDRFELFIAGRELANGFSELNNPIEQRRRFEAQQSLHDSGDEEAMVIDDDYLNAMQYGMPPAAGLGIGIDRLIMFLTGTESIREVILFPQVRHETHPE